MYLILEENIVEWSFPDAQQSNLFWPLVQLKWYDAVETDDGNSF
jgi:hypothetical protein